MSSVIEQLRQVEQLLNLALDVLSKSGVKDDILNPTSIKKLVKRNNELSTLVKNNEKVFLKTQADQVDPESLKGIKLNIKLVSLEQKQDKESLNRAKTDDEKSALQKVLAHRSHKLTQLHTKLKNIKANRS